jgi:hypothetical protein
MPLETVYITNPNVAANTPIPLPGGVMLDKIVNASLLDTGNYPDASAVAPVALSVQTSIPSGGLTGGQIALVGHDQVQVGTATNDGYQTLLVTGWVFGTRPKTTYSTAGVRGGNVT